jgi:NADH-quinone oxidoreductase subunit E
VTMDERPRTSDHARSRPSERESACTPRLSSETQERIRAQVVTYPKKRTALLPALKLAQDQVGYLPPEAIAEVAELVWVSHAAAQELATFYSMLRTHPGGGLWVEVCVQLPCAVAGGERLLKELATGLGIDPGQTTPDRRVTLIRTSECLGGCHRAPMCRVNGDYVENLRSPESVTRLLEALKSGRPPLMKSAGGEHAA